MANEGLEVNYRSRYLQLYIPFEDVVVNTYSFIRAKLSLDPRPAWDRG